MQSVTAFERSGCSAFEAYATARDQALALDDGNENHLCGAEIQYPSAQGQNRLHGSKVSGAQFGDQYVWSVPITSTAGTHYIFLLEQPHVPVYHPWYQELLHFAFPQLFVAIVVGGLTTYALVLIFTRPLVRLRKAARELAQGNLKTRVKASPRPPRELREDEFKALAHDFNHMAGRLESLVDAQHLLLRDVSHELRSPLARLSVALELAREDAAPEMSVHLNRIEREAEQLNQLIGQLLTLSSMEAGEKADNFQPISLNMLIEEIIPDAEYEAQQRQTSIVFETETDCTIAGNRELLYRAIENVVRNAVRYTEPGSAVEIRLRQLLVSGRQTAVLEISDQGPGIPETHMSDIFRPFFRVDPARSTETGGFGVGLAIADRAMKLHGSELRAANRSGGGATIRMSFPISPPQMLLPSSPVAREKHHHTQDRDRDQ